MPRPAGVPVFNRFVRSFASIQINKNNVRRFRNRAPGASRTLAVPRPAYA
ncbi:MAG: hypothetical protein ACRDTH_28640 [Pseudonocardiaceae bacterium]